MNFLRKIFSSAPSVKPQALNAEMLSAADKKLLADCQQFLANGHLSEELKDRIAHYRKIDEKLSDYQTVELILDHQERQSKK